jgi:hypothetical protein
MPKFTLIKHSEFEGDAEVSVTFSTDQLGLAKDHFDDFMKASGFELPLDNRMSGYVIPSPSEWEWDDKGEFKLNKDIAYSAYKADIIKFPERNNNKND